MTPCVLHQGRFDENGYGKIGVKWAHRVAWERAFGPVPPGLWIDHLCRNRGCVNPEHLEAVTPKVNLDRATTAPKLWAQRLFCKNGHPYTEENTAINTRGNRVCRICARDRYTKWKQRHAVR